MKKKKLYILNWVSEYPCEMRRKKWEMVVVKCREVHIYKTESKHLHIQYIVAYFTEWNLPFTFIHNKEMNVCLHEFMNVLLLFRKSYILLNHRILTSFINFCVSVTCKSKTNLCEMKGTIGKRGVCV